MKLCAGVVQKYFTHELKYTWLCSRQCCAALIRNVQGVHLAADCLPEQREHDK